MLFERPIEPGRKQLTWTVDRKLVLTCENQALDKDSSSSCTPAAPGTPKNSAPCSTQFLTRAYKSKTQK
jgi:hypothetical protein